MLETILHSTNRNDSGKFVTDYPFADTQIQGEGLFCSDDYNIQMFKFLIG